MTENKMNWDEVDVDEAVTAAEQKGSDSLDNSTPVGKFICTVVECNPKERAFKEYSCIAANLKMRIDEILELEQPLLDDKGQPVKRNGEVVKKKQKVRSSQAISVNALYAGRFVFDEINLFNPKEKEAMKSRRLFVAKRLRLITPQSVELKTSAWPGSVGSRVIVETEWNHWEDKATKEQRKNVKVPWSGYEFAPEGDTSFDTEAMDAEKKSNKEEFDI